MQAEDLWGEDGIFGFPIKCSAVLTHLKQDMRDDWLFDTIQYNDLFSKQKSLKEVLCSLLLEGDGVVTADKRILCDIPKKGFGIRYALETDFYDRFIYQALCSFLIPYFDPLLSYRVLSHRYNEHRDEEKYIFKKRIELWKTFEGVTYTTFKDQKTLLVTDLVNYFENISIEAIRSAFLRLIPSIKANGKEKLQVRNAIEFLCKLLEKWGYSDKHGLPQNRDASSFIANVVLNEVDQKIVAMGYNYFRYVDDIRIICESTQHARKALNELIRELRVIGMNINSAKTKILTSNSNNSELTDIFPGADDRSIAIDNMWRSKSRRVISRSIPLICEIIKECLEISESQSRQFRFSVNRLSMLAEADVFDIQPQLGDSLVSMIINTLGDQPASTDQFCRILGILDLNEKALDDLEKFLCDDTRAIHLWQNYYLWFLFAKKKYSSEVLVRTAIDRAYKNPQSIESSAIFIYLYCVQGSDWAKELIPQFSREWSFQSMRFFLFSLKDLSADELKPLIRHLPIKSQETLIRAKPFFSEGLPLVEREKVSLFDMYDNISPYD